MTLKVQKGQFDKILLFVILTYLDHKTSGCEEKVNICKL
jgi:hypothetical protein